MALPISLCRRPEALGKRGFWTGVAGGGWPPATEGGCQMAPPAVRLLHVSAARSAKARPARREMEMSARPLCASRGLSLSFPSCQPEAVLPPGSRAVYTTMRKRGNSLV